MAHDQRAGIAPPGGPGTGRVTGTPRLFAGLLDDAAVFPPGNVPMPDAVRAYRERRALPLLGAFICALPRWGELREQLTAGPPLRVALTVPGGAADLPAAIALARAEPRVELAALEVPATAAGLAVLANTADRPVPVYVELPWADVDATTVAALVDAGLRLKIRTGGLAAAAFPAEQQLAEVLRTAVRGGVAFKLTAGLHDPIRHRDPATGFEHHGYLNVLLATARALAGGDVLAALADQDGARVAGAVAAIGDAPAERIRRHFISFGTCSVTEPVDGLLRHGLLPEDPR
ncbi:hypothetical protein Ani05nite_09420 [Amorphoplanes nipponensis]|uniref:Uncharacterized protein n=1 Tax=Actinoplanes nipponensis TaxID=135950 RepID=A0A919JCQ9_9ACTN|nr:hypothetical protein [Actinoplanes nipponensis]GIE47408.1 hypothetical protein Ani05nite_09420 [Actinoplanes nipponensis]